MHLTFRYRLLGFDTDVSLFRSCLGQVFCRLVGHSLEQWHTAPYVFQKGDREYLVIREQLQCCVRCGQFAIRSEE